MADLTHLETRERVRALRAQNDLDTAAATLEKAVRQNALELADVYGMLGGVRRDQGDLAAASAAYDAGFKIDTDFGTLSTYNALNRVITRVMLAPEALSDPDVLRGEERLVFVDVCAELAKFEEQLRRNISGARSDDYWAAADLAIVAALNGHLAEATDAVDHFSSCSPPAEAFESFHRGLDALARIDTPRKATLESVRERLELRRG